MKKQIIVIVLSVVAFVVFLFFAVSVAILLEMAMKQISNNGIKPGLERLWNGTNSHRP